jgi:hypothetical protein
LNLCTSVIETLNQSRSIEANMTRGVGQDKRGRPKGALNFRNRDIVNDWIKAGRIQPLYVLLEQTEWAYKKALIYEKLCQAEGRLFDKKGKPTDAMKKQLYFREMAAAAAQSAARWVHPQLANVQVQGDEANPVRQITQIEYVIRDPKAGDLNGSGPRAVEGSSTSGQIIDVEPSDTEAESK